jgi:Tfp pilus assembly protein PilV
VRAEIPANGRQRTARHTRHNTRSQQHAFTLLEVIIACAIFFMAAFAILELVTTGLAQARALEQREPDAGMLAATLSLTNQLVEGADSGDFEDVAPGLYKEYRWARDINEVSSNSLFQVDFIVYRDAKKKGPSETKMSILLFRPGSKPGSASGALGGR